MVNKKCQEVISFFFLQPLDPFMDDDIPLTQVVRHQERTVTTEKQEMPAVLRGMFFPNSYLKNNVFNVTINMK